MKILFLLLLSLQLHAATLADIVGINSFLGDGRYGTNWTPETLQSQVKLKRFYLTYGEFSETPGIYAIDFTVKQWAWKESLQEYKSQGDIIIAATQGGFFFQTTAGAIEKRMPVNQTDDMYNPQSWYYAVRGCYHLAALYGANPNAQLYPNELQQAQPDPNYRRPTVPIAGQNLIDYIEIGQELLGWKINWSGVTRVCDARAYAVFFWEAYKEIRRADPEMKILVGALVHNDTILNNQFRQWVYNLSGSYPEQLHKVTYNFHNYIHNGMIGQTRTTGISPEQVNLNLNYWNRWKFMVTEFGYDEVQASNQSTPILSGLTAQQSQWEMNLRNIAWYSTASNCVGIIPYEIRNENDGSGGQYSTSGMYTKTYTPKQGVPIWDNFYAQAGGFVLPATYTNVSGTHRFAYSNGTASYSTGKVTFSQQQATIGVFYSTSPTRSNPLALPMLLPPGSYYVFAEPASLVSPVIFTLKKNGVTVSGFPRSEGAYPWDMMGGSSSTANPFTFTDGSYQLTVTAGGGANIVLSFTVATTAREEIVDEWYENGYLYFKTNTGRILQR